MLAGGKSKNKPSDVWGVLADNRKLMDSLEARHGLVGGASAGTSAGAEPNLGADLSELEDVPLLDSDGGMVGSG